jgi:hypothetical protein
VTTSTTDKALPSGLHPAVMFSLQEYTDEGGMECKANEDDPEPTGNNRAPRYVQKKTGSESRDGSTTPHSAAPSFTN